MYQKRIKRDFIHATTPNSDKPLKITQEISDKEKREIEICLNCSKPQCRWGNCKELRGKK